MPTRAPGQHPAEGATIQEHMIEHQKDQLADDQAQLANDHGRQSPVQRETWQSWMPSVPATMTAAAFVRYTNSRLDTGSITVDDLDVWQDDGILPDPVEVPSDPPRQLYPRDAWQVIAELLHPEWPDWQEADPISMRQRLRSTAQIINNTAAHTTDRQTWRDLMPDGFPMPGLLSHDELLERLHDRGVDISPYTLEHYRRNGIIPRPIRRKHERKVRPVYPVWYVPLIETLKDMQSHGRSLDEIRDAIRPFIQMHIANTVQWRDRDLDEATAALDAALRDYARVSQPRLASDGTINSIHVELRDADGTVLNYHDIPHTPD